MWSWVNIRLASGHCPNKRYYRSIFKWIGFWIESHLFLLNITVEKSCEFYSLFLLVWNQDPVHLLASLGHCLDETPITTAFPPWNNATWPFQVFLCIQIDPWSLVLKTGPQQYEPPLPPSHDALTLSTVLCALGHEFSVWGSSDKLTEAPQEQIIGSVFAIGGIQSNQMTVFHFLPYCSAFGCILDHFNWEIYHYLQFFLFVFSSLIGGPTL